jgi:nitroreductase
MEYSELISKRYSVRAYKPDAVEEEKLIRILEAAQIAPTAANRQPFRIVVCHTQGRKEDFNKVYHREWLASAPLVIAVCGVQREAWVRSDGKSYIDVDVAIVMDHLILAATDEGLGTCWIANFIAEEARRVLELPNGVEPIVLTPLGYPADQPKPKERKLLDSLVYFERWGGTK